MHVWGTQALTQMSSRRPYLQTRDKAHTGRVDKALHFFNHRAWEDGSHLNQTSAVNCYTDCCISNDLPPFPVTYKSLGYFAVTCRLRGNKQSYLKTLISNIKTHCTRTGQPYLSTAEEVPFKFVMRGLAKFNPAPTERKRPITKAVLEAITLHADLNNPKDLQTITMAYLAHDALLRGRELMHLKIGHLQWDPRRPDRCTIHITASKCNKTGPTEEAHIVSYGSRSGVSLLQQYISAMLLRDTTPSAPLFPLIVQLSGSGGAEVQWEAIHDKDRHFVPAIRALLQAAGYDASEYSGHSFRAGGATDLWTAGCAPEVIKRAGRWKSDCFYIYIRTDPQQIAVEVASYFGAL